MQNKELICDDCSRPAIGKFNVYNYGECEDGSDDEMMTIAACYYHKPPNLYEDFEITNKQLTLF